MYMFLVARVIVLKMTVCLGWCDVHVSGSPCHCAKDDCTSGLMRHVSGSPCHCAKDDCTSGLMWCTWEHYISHKKTLFSNKVTSCDILWCRAQPWELFAPLECQAVSHSVLCNPASMFSNATQMAASLDVIILALVQHGAAVSVWSVDPIVSMFAHKWAIV